MADRETFNEAVANYTGGQDAQLEVGSRDGQIYVRLRISQDGPPTACLLEPETAATLVTAIHSALGHLKIQGSRP